MMHFKQKHFINMPSIEKLCAFILLSLCSFSLHSCLDEMQIMPYHEYSNGSKSTIFDEASTGGLIQQPDGTWKSNNRRVPLVGCGRIVNSFAGNFISAENTNYELGNIVDMKFDNSTLANLGLLSANISDGDLLIASVRDINRKYSKDQTVGFVIEDDQEGGSVLSLDLLKKICITLYNDGKPTEKIIIDENSDTGLGIGLLSLPGSGSTERAISVNATKTFDEVGVGLVGVNAELLSNSGLKIKYAFVGDNPEITTYDHNNEFWDGGAPVINTGKQSTFYDYTQDIIYSKYIVDDVPETYAYQRLSLISGYDIRVTVNFNKIIPENYEIGFKYSYENAFLGLGLLGQDGPELHTYNEGTKDEPSIQSVTPPVSLLNIGVSSGETPAYASMIVTGDNTRQLQIMLDKGLISGILDGLLGSLLGKKLYIHYAYVRKPISLDPSCYFNVSDYVTKNNSQKLPNVQPIDNIVYEILSHPYGTEPEIKIIDGRYYIENMTRNGSYRIKATYLSPENEKLEQTFTVYRKTDETDISSGCNTYITASSHGAYATDAIGWSGCLLCLFNGNNNMNYIVDNNTDNYASLRQFASVVGNQPMVAIKMNKPIVPKGEIRTGFVLNSHNSLLGISALQNYSIRLYRGETLVDSNDGTDNNKTLDVGVVNSNEGKVRISIKTDKEFDRIELWKFQATTILESINVYNVFYEDVSCEDDISSESCMELMSNSTHNLNVNYDATKLGDGISVGSYISNLGYAIDSSIETGTLMGGGVNLLSEGTKISFTFDKIGYQPVGIILGGMPDLIDVDLISGVKIEAYNDDVKITDNISYDIIGVNLLSKDGYSYVEVTPSGSYNRIDISFNSSILSLLNNAKLCGVYTRPDSDGDGIPDCAETNSDNGMLTLKSGITEICGKEPLKLEVTEGGIVGNEYQLVYKNTTTGRVTTKLQQLESGKYFSINELEPGQYYISVYDADGVQLLYNNAEAWVHPLLTEWTGTVDSDWENWDNWTMGMPGGCTDVIIPKNMEVYPEISNFNAICNNIHFEEGACLLGAENLIYECAFVDVLLMGGHEQFISFPLQEVFSGDVFINSEYPWGRSNYFTVMNATNYPEERFNPIFYQKLPNNVTVEEVSISGSELLSTQINSDSEFNSLSTEYLPGHGVSVRAGEIGNKNSYRLRLPKSHGQYQYFYANGQGTGQFISLNRNESLIGKLNTEDYYQIEVTDKSAVLVGNPYIARLDIGKFIEINNLQYLRIADENGFITYTYENNTLVSTGGQSLPAYLVPAQAVLIEGATSIIITRDMLCDGNIQTSQPDNVLAITAFKEGQSSTCLLVKSNIASDAFIKDEDIVKVIQDIDKRKINVFTVNDGYATEVQRMNKINRVPLGLMTDTRGSVTLKINNKNGFWNGWQLVDKDDNKSYDIIKGENVIELHNVVTSDNRIYLQKK